MIKYPSELNIIFNKLKNNGLKIIIIGGFVRDSLLNIDSKDIDIEVYGISSLGELENILKEFGSVNSVGKSFGVCKLQFKSYELDFSLPRIDNKISFGHRGFEVKVNPNLDFATAASRRDFTINAIGYDVIEKKILDPFNGIDDLKHKILRAVNQNTFTEDPLRVLRAAQFCARFELRADKTLSSLCKKMVADNKLSELPKERVFEEIKKLLLKSKIPSIGFRLIKEFGSDLYTDNMSVVDEISKRLTTNIQTNLSLMLAGLCYNFNLKQTTDFILKLTDEKELLARTLPLVEFHNEIDLIYAEGLSSYSLYKLAAKVKIEELLILSSAIYFAKNSSDTYNAGEAIYKRAKELNILKEKLPALLKGKDLLMLGFKPSPEFSNILDTAYEAQIMGKFNTLSEAVEWLKNLKFSKRI